MNNLKYILLLIASVFILSCTKDDDDDHHEATNVATFNILSPVEGQEFTMDDTVFIIGSATGTEDLHGYELTAKDLSNGSTLFSADDHVHGMVVTLDTFFVNNSSSPRDLSVTFKVALDHDGNTAEKVVKVKAK